MTENQKALLDGLRLHLGPAARAAVQAALDDLADKDEELALLRRGHAASMYLTALDDPDSERWRALAREYRDKYGKGGRVCPP